MKLAREMQQLWSHLRAVVRDDRASVTAEFALVLPVIAALVAICVGAIALSAQQIRLTALAADMARVEARGEGFHREPSSVMGYAVRAQRSTDDVLLCVELSAHPMSGALAAVTITARSCALRSEASAQP